MNIKKSIFTVCTLNILLLLSACEQTKNVHSPSEVNPKQQPTLSSTDDELHRYYRVHITMQMLGSKQTISLDRLALPKNEQEFCQNQHRLQENLPEGADITACSFNDRTGHASFIYKVKDQTIESDAIYQYEPM